MVWKKVPTGDSGTTDMFGGDDMNKVSDAFAGVDVDDFDINLDTQFRQDKLQVRNAANTFGHKHRSAATAARTITYPDKDINFNKGRTDVYKIGATYYAEKYDGTLIASSGTFQTVLQAALDLQGLVTIEQDGVFQLTTASGGLQYSRPHRT